MTNVMEHKLIPDAIELVTKAITADNEGEYEKALPLYCDALGRFNMGLEYERDEARRKYILEHADVYMKRAEYLRDFLNNKNDPSNKQEHVSNGGRGDDDYNDKENTHIRKEGFEQLQQKTMAIEQKRNSNRSFKNSTKLFTRNIRNGVNKIGDSARNLTKSVGEKSIAAGRAIGQKTKETVFVAGDSIKNFNQEHNITGKVGEGAKMAGKKTKETAVVAGDNFKNFNNNYNVTGRVAGLAATFGVCSIAGGNVKRGTTALAVSGAAAVVDKSMKPRDQYRREEGYRKHGHRHGYYRHGYYYYHEY